MGGCGGYEQQLTPTTNVNLQGYISKSVYTHDQTDLDELLSEKYQLGFQVGLAYIPELVSRAL